MKKILSLLFGLIFCCLSSTAASAATEAIKFIQVADAHLSVDSEYSQKVLRSAVEDINKQQNISFVVFTGDNIGNPTPENLRAFVKIVSKLKVPYYVALGNHDVYKSKELSKVRYYEILRERNLLYPQRSSNYEFKKRNFVFLIVDGAKEVIPGSVGYYRQDTLDWVDKVLAQNEKKSVIIFQHFPIVYPDGSESSVRSHKTYRVDEYEDVLNEHNNVLAVVSGHFHLNGETMKNGVYHIASPSLIGLPQAYKIIDIITTKDFSPIIYTQLREFEVKD
ncbi:hypothetical protein HDR58_03960 [bacterium]|nr:hypothetical protein [bacterium]